MSRKPVGHLYERALTSVENAIGEPLTDPAWNALCCLTRGELTAVAHWLEGAKRSLVSHTLAAERGES